MNITEVYEYLAQLENSFQPNNPDYQKALLYLSFCASEYTKTDEELRQRINALIAKIDPASSCGGNECSVPAVPQQGGDGCNNIPVANNYDRMIRHLIGWGPRRLLFKR